MEDKLILADEAREMLDKAIKEAGSLNKFSYKYGVPKGRVSEAKAGKKFMTKNTAKALGLVRVEAYRKITCQ